MPRIIATVAPDGKVSFRVEGASGPACTSLTAALEKALGVVEKREKTSDFYKQAVPGQKQKESA